MRVIVLALMPMLISAVARQRIVGIPTDAEIVESQDLPQTVRVHRAIVLWMVKPEDHPSGTFDEHGNPVPIDEPYTCPEYSRGWFKRGQTRISLIDTQAQRVINSVRVVMGDMQKPKDQFDVPYLIASGHYYAVPGVPKGIEGRPKLLDLRDIDGDGSGLEFALYDMPACTGPQTFLFGYDPRRDRIVHYAVHLNVDGGKGLFTASLDQLFYHRPSEPRHWRYRVYYNVGEECEFDVRLRPSTRKLEGSVKCEAKQ